MEKREYRTRKNVTRVCFSKLRNYSVNTECWKPLRESCRFSNSGNLNRVIEHLLKLLGLGKLSKFPGEEHLSNKRALE